MDLFLLEGYSALIRMCLTLLKLIESTPTCHNILFFIIDDLMDLSYDESMVFLKTFGRHLETDVD